MDVTTKPIEVYVCGNCGKSYLVKSQAETCCVSNKCKVCGKEMVYQYRDICDECLEEQRWRNAKNRLTYDEYVAETGHGHVFLDDIFYDTWEDLEDAFESNGVSLPEGNIGIYGARYDKEGFDPNYLIEILEDDLPPDYEVDEDQIEFINKFCREFNEKYARTIWYPAYDIAIITAP